MEAMRLRRRRHWQEIQALLPDELGVGDSNQTEFERRARKDAGTRFAQLHGILEWSPRLPRAMRQAYLASTFKETDLNDDQDISSAWLNVVDLGCGDGAMGRAFRDLADSLYGVDLSLPMIERIRSLARVRDRRSKISKLMAAAGNPKSMNIFPYIREFQRLAMLSAEEDDLATSPRRMSPVQMPGAIGVDDDVKRGLMPGGLLK